MDMTRKQFLAALKRHGMTVELGCMGYVKLGPAREAWSVSYFNAPNRTWRGALAYLLARKEQMEAAK
jgi:hypothetical protein